ncbi:MAG: serine/threonine-protein kinase, partial [Gemmatimonadota bacterium]
MSDGHTERLTSAVAGRYRLERKLGEGGMAAVYLAEDLKHERKVALKVLRPELAAALGAERFLAEIRTTANLQHPHVLPLFDSGEADGYLYYVMPFVEGETLRDKLDRDGQLGVEESVGIARDVAGALDYAHRHGVIHRDIKPGNILLHDGRPVVADFGIALAVSAAGGGRMTETGLSLGTPHYMSPEQASPDQDATPRSDVYSLGCVLYEMLAGQPPHTGPTAQSILVRILTESPRSLADVRHTVPAHVAAAVTKAIEKLPADRFGGAQEFADALDNTGFTYRPRADAMPASAAAAADGAQRGTSRRLHAAATVLLAVTTAVFGWMALRTGEGSPRERGGVVSFVLPQTRADLLFPIVGNDGSIAYQSETGGLDLLAPGTVDPVPLTGTEGVYRGVFSPDAQWLAFVQETDDGGHALRRMPATGGPASTLWETRGLYGPNFGAVDWGGGGWIYISTGGVVGRVPEGGGPLDTLFALDSGFAADLALLPGASGLLLTIGGGPMNAENHIAVLDLVDGDTSTVTESGFGARWVSSGHVIYATGQGALYALPFDPRRLEPTGPPVLAADDASPIGNFVARFDVSSNGTLAYMRGPSSAEGGGGYALVSPAGDMEVLRLEPTDHPDVSL